MYQYNSIHKIIAAVAIVLWAIFHFSGKKDNDIYYDNGQITRTGEVVNSLNEGVWTWFHKNGNLQIQGEFKQGKRVGKWKRYDEKSRLVTEWNYENGKLNGEFIEFDTLGNISEKHFYQDDLLVSRKQSSQN
ncbi:MAG: toxin-antitoxin system YwqK family antitoxin [Bacteroidia bacterium]